MIAPRSFRFALDGTWLNAYDLTKSGLTIHGIVEPGQLHRRVPTFAFTLGGWHPRKVCEELDKAGINAWDGNYYAPEVTRALGLEGKGGMVRVGAAHYTTLPEVRVLAEAVRAVAARAP